MNIIQQRKEKITMKIRILAIVLATLMLMTAFISCKKEEKKGDGPITIYTLNGTTGFGMAKLMNDSKDGSKYEISVKTDAADVTAALINGDVDIAALPTNAAANVYNKTQGGVKILAVNTLGCLYLLTKDGVTVSSFADLRGKTVYVPAQNPTFIFTDLCKKNGLTPGTDITIDSTSYAQPANLRDAVASGAVEIAVLPEPMVTVAMSKAKQANVTLKNALDLTAEWDKVNTPGSLVQGCVVVRTEYLENNPEKVAEFLKDYKASIEFLNTNTAEAAQMIQDTGIFAQAAVAEKAIPKCNVCYLDGAEMKGAMEIYLNALMGINANAIGGKLPGADFYYNAE
ncbi:MAG: ABC transporter substrate-binding protein [Ruminococcaceae bacterium]|nr:ABC transporter substrate-binding protein [Oscillospiraceae bacterium]